MKRALALLLTIAAVQADGAEVSVYLCSYTHQRDTEGIYLAHLDADTGKLGVPTRAAVVQDSSFAAISKDGKFLYAATDVNGGAVAALRVDGEKLTLLNVKPTGAGGCCHVSLDAAGRHVLSASYGAGTVAALPINPDGSLGERTGFAQFTGAGPNAERQMGPHAHSIYSDGRFVYSCDLGNDNVWSLQLDPDKGTLTPTDPPSGKVPAGSGPRHLAWHPRGKFAYVNGEMGMNVTVFARHAGSAELTPLQTISSLPPGVPLEGNSSAEIICHPSGKWLYVSNRGHDSLTVFEIGDDGKLSWIENVPAAVKFPRSFNIDPTGKWLLAAGQNDHRIAVFGIDPATGKLKATGETISLGAPMCVLFGGL